MQENNQLVGSVFRLIEAINEPLAARKILFRGCFYVHFFFAHCYALTQLGSACFIFH